jgi:hypothetical protein
MVTTSGYASGATATQAVHSLPASVIPTRTILECVEVMTYSAGTTTGATAIFGIAAGDLDGYATSVNLGTMTAGQKILLTAGVVVGTLDATARATALTITPTGGAADSDEISGGRFIVHQEYDVAPDRVS